MIFEPRLAEATLAEGQADFVALGRAFIDDPSWVWHAAEQLSSVDRARYTPAV